jgi:hypothetical protein
LVVLALQLWPPVATAWWWLGLLAVVLAVGSIHGLGSGLLSLGLAAACLTFFWLAPRYSFRVTSPGDLLVLGIFLGVGLLSLTTPSRPPMRRTGPCSSPPTSQRSEATKSGRSARPAPSGAGGSPSPRS